MMNKKAQELSMWGIIFGIFGLVISVVMTRMMNPGIFWGGVAIVGTTFVCYLIGWKASDN